MTYATNHVSGTLGTMAPSLPPAFEDWLPKSVSSLRTYSLATFRHDLIAGVTVGLVALPLGMAFAIASGLTPESGIYCAIVTGFIISALGGSRVQIGGPTGAFVVALPMKIGGGSGGPPRAIAILP